jgi:hypothetical protein
MEYPYSAQNSVLNCNNIYCGRAFFPLLYVKGTSGAFSKRLEAIPIDSRMMNEYIRTIFLLNEAIAFLVIKPLHDSISHSDNLLSLGIPRSLLRG